MTLLEDDDYNKIETTLLLYNGNIQEISKLILSYCFFVIPRSLRKLLAENFYQYNIQKEADVSIGPDRNNWEYWLKKEVKLRVGVLLCDSVISNELMFAMIVLPKLKIFSYFNEEHSPIYNCDGHFWTYNLKKKETISNHNMEVKKERDYFQFNSHRLSWFRVYNSMYGQRLMVKPEITVFGGRIRLRTEHIQFCLKTFNHCIDYAKWQVKIHK